MAIATVPKERPFRLTDDDPNITADSTFGTTWRKTWKFQCPEGMVVILKPGDTFSAVAYDSADVEYVAPDAEIKVEVADPSENTTVLVYGPANYLSSTNFQQYTHKRKLRILTKVRVETNHWIIVSTRDSLGMDAASILTSYFVLNCWNIA